MCTDHVGVSLQCHRSEDRQPRGLSGFRPRPRLYGVGGESFLQSVENATSVRCKNSRSGPGTGIPSVMGELVRRVESSQDPPQTCHVGSALSLPPGGPSALRAAESRLGECRRTTRGGRLCEGTPFPGSVSVSVFPPSSPTVHLTPLLPSTYYWGDGHSSGFPSLEQLHRVETPVCRPATMYPMAS